MYARDLLDDIDRPVTGPTPLLLDSQSAVELTYDPVAFKKTKHILRRSAPPMSSAIVSPEKYLSLSMYLLQINWRTSSRSLWAPLHTRL